MGTLIKEEKENRNIRLFVGLRLRERAEYAQKAGKQNIVFYR